ncbi:NUDIX domain-containing protein [Streptomyces noursei]|uniref:NUDIX domain-containing protein n=1 Tax=Streptomyces noursei TaxID=1971 RepID=UPI0038159ED2
MSSQTARGPYHNVDPPTLLERLRSDPSLTIGRLATNEEIPLSTLRDMGFAPAASDRPKALVWNGDTGEPGYAPHIAQWGTARWLGRIRDRARSLGMAHLPVLQSLLAEKPLVRKGAGGHVSSAMATMMAPSREALIHAALAAGLIQAPAARQTPVLRPDCQATLLCMAAGLSIRDSAQVLRVSVPTITLARDTVRRALEARDDVRAVGLAWAARLLHAGSQLAPIPEMRSPGFALVLGPELPYPPAVRIVTASALAGRPDGAVLMVRSTHRADSQLYRLPATRVRRGEGPRRAVERILLEEAGLRAVAGRQVLQAWVPGEPGSDDVMVLVYDCGTVGSSGMPLSVEEDQGEEPIRRWIMARDFPLYCHRHQGFRVARALAAQSDGSHVELSREDALW